MFQDEKTYNLCHLTKMKMVTTKAVILSIFQVILELILQNLLFLNEKSIYYTNLHKKKEKVTTNYAH